MSKGIKVNHTQKGNHKTLTDDNANEWIEQGSTGSAVNQVKITNAATGTSPIISASGDDSNIGLTLTPKGTGAVKHTLNYDAWVSGLTTADQVTALGNRSYTVRIPSVDYTDRLSAGMRLRTTRTVAAPTQCTSLNGTTQYYSKASPNKLTFTNNFVVSAWVKLSSYATSSIVTRYNGTSGWKLDLNSSGQVQFIGLNGGAGNYALSTSYQSLPLNKWVHIACQLDMSTTSTGTTNNYIMIDGVEVPNVVTRAGTNPVTLVQAGNLEIGSQNGGGQFFPGKIAQVAIYNAKVTQANILATISQGLSGSETSLASAYSFNGVKTDLNTSTPNDLTANGSAVETNADSPFGGQGDGTISSTLDYAIITKTAFSTNTTLTVQVPEGCTIPTSGGVSAVSYSTQKTPYQFPAQKGKWVVQTISKSTGSQGTPTQNTWYNINSLNMTIPIGEWSVRHAGCLYATKGASTILTTQRTLSTGNNSETDTLFTVANQVEGASGTMTSAVTVEARGFLSLTSATIYYLNNRTTTASVTSLGNLDGNTAFSPSVIEAELALL